MHSFSLVVDQVRKAEPDLVVVAGDVFDKPVVTPAVMCESIRLFAWLSEHVTVVITGGNHERPTHTANGSPLAVLSAAVERVLVVATEPTWIQTPRQYISNPHSVSVLCVPDHCMPTKEQMTENLGNRILVMHAAVQGDFDDIDYARYTNSIHIRDLNPESWDYIALGDYHSYAKLAPNAYYSGSIDYANAGPWDEAGEPKGWVLFDTEKPELGAVHQPIETRPVFDFLEIDCADGGLTRINTEIAERADSCGESGAIMRQRLVNVSPAVHAGIDRKMVKQLKADALHYQLKEELVSTPETAEAPEAAPIRDMVSDFVMDGWSGDPALKRSDVRDSAVGLIDGEQNAS